LLLQEDETQKSAIMIDLEKKNESSATTIDIDEKKELTPLPQKLLEACRSNEDDNGKVDTEVVDYCHWHWRYDYTLHYVRYVHLCTLCTACHPPGRS
jgi:hypothetical protein